MSPAAAAAAAAAAEPVQVMVLGTYHFDNPGLDLNNMKADDVTLPKRQAELQALSNALAAFKPTKIMVEVQPKSADLADARFTSFTPSALRTEKNETVQIGYRLAHQLKLAKVHAIDEQPGAGEPNYFPFGKVAEFAKATKREAQLREVVARGAAVTKGMEEMQKRMTIAQVLLERNRPETVHKEMAMYYDVLAMGDTEQQPGADLNAMWYLRNAKIFAKLMTVTAPGDRVLVIYGAGHNYWLRHFASMTPGYTSVDPVPYLQAASR
jgi:hypothetical protein